MKTLLLGFFILAISVQAMAITKADFCALNPDQLANNATMSTLEKLPVEYQYFGNERGYVIDQDYVFNTNVSDVNEGYTGILHVGLFAFENYPTQLIDTTSIYDTCEDREDENHCIARLFVSAVREKICQ